MNIYSYIKQDHEKVTRLFELIIKTRSNTKRQSLFIKLKEKLLSHADAEHETFYKALKKYSETKEIVKHADKEHAEVKDYLDKLTDLSSNNNRWMVLLGELKYAVEHHVKEEEKKMFSMAKKVLNKELAIALVGKMAEFKAKTVSV